MGSSWTSPPYVVLRLLYMLLLLFLFLHPCRYRIQYLETLFLYAVHRQLLINIMT